MKRLLRSLLSFLKGKPCPQDVPGSVHVRVGRSRNLYERFTAASAPALEAGEGRASEPVPSAWLHPRRLIDEPWEQDIGEIAVTRSLTPACSYVLLRSPAVRLAV
jgi:hypothetical protein